MSLLAIAARELRSLFLSPLAWAILGVVQFLLAYMFLAQVDTYMAIQPRLAGLENAPGITEIVVAPIFGNAAVVLLLITPLLTMRLLAEERRGATLSLLLSAPVRISDIVLGKYLGVLGFFAVLLLLLLLMPLSLTLGGTLDLGRTLGGLLGIGLLIAAFCAIGLYISSLTAQPTVAAVATFGVLLMLWIIDWAGQGGEQSGLLGYLSLLRHYEALLKGLFDTADLAYYLLLILTFLGLTIRRLEAERLPH